MDLIEDIISAGKKPPVVVQGTSISKKPQKKVHFQKNGSKEEKNSRRSAGMEASRISSVHGRKKAQDVVLHLIENTVTANELEEMCRNIIPGQYEDVCLERCLSGVCGYPLCSVPYRDNYGKKDVIFRNNKVYEISRRRNYCSDVCFEASAIVGGQISFTPHYLREHETVEELAVVVPDSSTLRGLRGDLKDIGGDTEFAASMRERRQEQLHRKSRPQSSSRTVEEAALAGLLADEEGTPTTTSQEQETGQPHEQTTATLSTENMSLPSQPSDTINTASLKAKENGNIDYLEKTNKKNKKKHKPKNNSELFGNKNSYPSHSEDRTLDANRYNINNDDNISNACLDNQVITSTVGDSTQCDDRLNKSTEFSSDGITRKSPQLQRDKIREGSMATTKEGLVQQVEEHLLEWLTWDSYVIVLGETYLQGLLESHGIMSDHRTEQQPAFESAIDSDVCRLRYWRLCTQLARQERLEEMEAAAVASEERSRILKDAPDMETLRQDVQRMALKVKCFLSGREEPEQDELPPEDGEEDQRRKETPLPLVDRYEQRAWRRKVFFENIHKAERAVVAGLSLIGEEVRPLLSRLVGTLNLTAHNLYLKTPQWTLVLLVLLKLLGVRSPTIKSALTDVELQQREVLPRLESLALSSDYLESLLPTLLDGATIMKKFMEGARSGSTTSGAASGATQPFETESTLSQRDYSVVEELD